MVNISSMTMDEYGLVEPTDVGTMTINYDSKDESIKRRSHNRWDHDETLFMLKQIKEQNMIVTYTMNRMSIKISELMQSNGWHRTDKQVLVKLATLRKQFLTCEKDRIETGTFIACPYYNELRDIYHGDQGHVSSNIDNLDPDECFITFPNEYVNWSKGEIHRILTSIKNLKLKNEISLTSFSPLGIKMITDILRNAGFSKTTNQVRNVLNYLRTMYIDYRIGLENNKNPPECMFYPNLDVIWGNEYRRCRLKERKHKYNDTWSAEETALLLIQIQDLNNAEEAYIFPEKASRDLRISLAQKGCNKTESQILDRLYQLKTDFAEADKCYSEAEAIRKFTFYPSYKRLFKRFYDNDETRSDSSLSDTWSFNDNLSDNAKEADWEPSEVRLLLRTVQKLTSTNHPDDSLENEKLEKLSKTLSDNGYHKTAKQIKHKLTLLKDCYLKCNLEDNLEKDTLHCPFYEELHNIFSIAMSNEQTNVIQNILNSNNDLGNPPKDVDHSYTNISQFGLPSPSETSSNDKVTVVPNKCIDTWFPVESIIDEDALASASLEDLGNLSALSTTEQEQVIEEALLAALPKDNHCDVFAANQNPMMYNGGTINTNQTIVENQSIVDYVSQNNEVNVAGTLSYQNLVEEATNNVVIDQEVNSAIQGMQNQKAVYPTLNESESNGPTSSATKRVCSSGDDAGLPQMKKPRMIEDVKLSNKNKFLLRPIGMDSSTAINAANGTSTKFVRLIVANDNKTNNKNITAQIQPINMNLPASSNNSGKTSPIEKVDILKLAAEKMLENEKEVSLTKMSTFKEEIEAKITETITNAMQAMMDHNQKLQQQHHLWMEKQLELQRKYNDEINTMMMNEIKELRHTVTLLYSKQPLGDRKGQ